MVLPSQVWGEGSRGVALTQEKVSAGPGPAVEAPRGTGGQVPLTGLTLPRPRGWPSGECHPPSAPATHSRRWARWGRSLTPVSSSAGWDRSQHGWSRKRSDGLLDAGV